MSRCKPITLKNFDPPRFNRLKGEELHNQFMFDQKHQGIPIRGGTRVYIQLRRAKSSQVQAIDEARNYLIISAELKCSLFQSFAEYGSVIIEGYIDINHLNITDIASIDGKLCKMDLTSRLAVIRRLDFEPTYVELLEPVEIDATFLETSAEKRGNRIRYFVIKNRQKGFQEADAYRSDSFLLPNFYTLTMSIIRRPSYGSNQYEVALIKGSSILASGTIESNRPMSKSDSVVVNFSVIKNGKLEDAWLADLTHYRNEPFEKSLNSLTDLSPCWAARLTSTYERQCLFNSNPNGAW